MKKRIKVTELAQREGLRGEIVQLHHSRRTGMIHGDDGYDVTFNDQSLIVGFGYSKLSLGLGVSYGLFFAAGASIPTAINVQPTLQTKTTEEAQKVALAEAIGERQTVGQASGTSSVVLPNRLRIRPANKI